MIGCALIFLGDGEWSCLAACRLGGLLFLRGLLGLRPRATSFRFLAKVPTKSLGRWTWSWRLWMLRLGWVMYESTKAALTISLN